MSTPTFVSYAQNREDVILWRALSHIENGFYIDVGANHPSDDSVTKAFYDRGWHGINIEPLPSHIQQLQIERKRDINLAIAAGSYDGTISIFDTPIRGWATASKDVANSHKANGIDIVEITVPIFRLDRVWENYVNQPVHFLKIDVEGFEENVLLGLNLSKNRPWIIVIEATKPNTKEIDVPWDKLISGKSYQLVYFDGLNRYYLSNEKSNLLEHFCTPVNVFDNYMSAEEFRLSKNFAQTDVQLKISKKIIEKQKNRLLQAEQNNINIQKDLNNKIDKIYASYSWRTTKPLRKLLAFTKKIKKYIIPNDVTNIQKKEYKNNLFRFHQKSLKACAQISFYLSDDELQQKKKWRIVGHIEGHYSLAAVNRGLSIALDKECTKNINIIPWHGQKYKPGNNFPIDQANLIREILDRPIADDNESISLVQHYPLIIDPSPAKLRLVLFFWEESRVPESMIAHLNLHSDAVITSSLFVKNALRYSGYANAIYVIPLGLPDYILNTPILTSPIIPKKGESFRFLHISSGFERKGLDILLKSYFQNFSQKDEVELYIKTFPNPHNNLESVIKTWQAAYPQGPKITLDICERSDAEMLEIYSKSHAMVLPSRGEGFGLPAAEAMALGLPVITTGHGGQTEFCTRETAFLIPYTFEYSRSHLRSDGSYWAEANSEDLAAQMHFVRNKLISHDKNMNLRCKAAIKWCRENYRWEKSARALNIISDNLLKIKKDATKRKIIIISPWNTRCGIAEYTQSLLEKWEDQFNLEILCDTRTASNDAQHVYQPCWTIGENSNISEIINRILIEDKKYPDVLLIQHQPSLFYLNNSICDLLLRLENSGITVILELHSTRPLARERRLTNKAVSALNRLSLIIVHQLEDVNNLSSIGLSSNVTTLPLGINQIDDKKFSAERKDFNLKPTDIVLGCFGFLWQHKGIDSVIKSLAILNKKYNKKFKLLAVTSTPDKNSLALLEKYKDLSESIGVKDDVVWITDFLPIQKSLQILSLADFQVFAYGPSSESASAAVTIGLATKKAVLVSPEPIFSDLSEYTYQLISNQEKDISQAVIHLLQNPEELNSLQSKQSQWVESRAWPKVASRFKNIISGLLVQKRLDQPLMQSMPCWNERKQLLVDVSELVLRDAGTGIQRVVHSILNEWQTNPPSGYVVRAVCAEKDKKYSYTSKFSNIENKELDLLNGKIIEANPGDIFVGLDLSAHLFPQVEEQLHSWRLQGVSICYVIYDIIPLLHPEKVIPQLIEPFEIWMKGLANEADRLICISKSVEKEVIRWISQKYPNLVLPEVSHFHLGANLPVTKKDTSAKVNNDLLIKIKNQTSFLMVGTVEPRKGYSQALNAMDLIWNSGKNVHLVIIGKRGWMVESLCDRIEHHPKLGIHLHWLEHADDEILTSLYKSCTALLAASEAEGFGLPLVEAAQHGLPIIARDIEVFKEIAQDHAFYFCTNDSEVLANTLEAWMTLHSQGFAPSSYNMPWISWHESANQLWNKVQ